MAAHGPHPAWVGVDPGGAETGVVARVGDECVTYTVVIRQDLPMGSYIAAVLEAVNGALDEIDVPFTETYRVAVEGVEAPKPHVRKRPINVQGLLDTAQVLGGVLAAWPSAVVVPPGGHGSGLLAAYPIELRPTRGRGRGFDVMRHARSAWDVAGAAPVIARLGAGHG